MHIIHILDFNDNSPHKIASIFDMYIEWGRKQVYNMNGLM